MNLYEIHVTHGSHTIQMRLLDVAGTHCIYRQSHCKQGICITAKYFTVKEITPAADNLSNHQSKHSTVTYFKWIDLLNITIYEQRCKATDHTAIYCQSTLSEIENTQQIVFVLIP